MQVFLDHIDWNSQFSSVEKFVETFKPEDGEQFELVQITVIASTKYKMINGQPVPQSIAFAEIKED